MESLRYELDTDEPLLIDGESLTLEDVVAVARHRRRVDIAPEARQRIDICRAMVEVLLEGGEKIYGLTTGFGKLRDIAIPLEETRQLQKNLIQSHSCGVGDPFAEDVVRAAMLLRANTLCRGNSGVRLSTIEQLVRMLNDDIFPYIPQKGSVGASGDLAPLSHLGLVLMGDPDGRYFPRENRLNPTEIIQHCTTRDFISMPDPADLDVVAMREGWSFHPVELEAKEGLAINNGTQFMTAVGCLAAYDGFFTVRYAEMAGAMSLEAIRGVRHAYDPRIHQVRRHRFQPETAGRIMDYCAGSQIIDLYFNTAHFNHAKIHFNNASEFVDHVVGELGAESTPIPLFLAATKKEIREILARIDGLLPKAEDGSIDESQTGKWSQLPPRQQIALFHELVAPLRQSAIDLLKSVETASHPMTSSMPRLRSALVAAVDQLNRVVPDTPIIQDDYSFRCFPQVMACAYHALDHVHGILVTEANSVTDNPLLFPPEPEGGIGEMTGEEYAQWLRGSEERIQRCRDGVVGGGNFHGEPVALAMDYLAVAMAETANIAERRIAHLVDDSHSRGLPPFLIESSGINSGFMIPQYTAAALVSENKVLSHPASVDSIPTCANTEDHVSMGTIAARKAAEIIKNVRTVVAIEILAAFQGLKYRQPLEPGKAIRKVLSVLREKGLKGYEDDHVIYPDIELVLALMSESSLLDCLLP